MTRVLVVHSDPSTAGGMADELRRYGYDVETCGGPIRERCPIGEGLPCPFVDRADVLVYDAWVAGDSDGGRRLISELRETYPDLPVVLTSADERLDWVEAEGPHRVIAFASLPSSRLLVDAVDAALTEQGMAV